MQRQQTNLLQKSNHLSQVLLAVAAVAAVVFVGMYLFTAIPRIFYPYDLVFIEDGILMGALRAANGQSLYVAPQADFTPHVYMPLYTWLGGLLFRLFRVGYVSLRSLSFFAVLVTAGLLFFIGKRESKQMWPGFLCASLFLGGYRIIGWARTTRCDTSPAGLYTETAIDSLQPSPPPRARYWC